LTFADPMTKNSPRADTAYQALRRAIIEHALVSGTKLPEDEIGSHFGMSRTLVRATLARLQSEGLVDTRPKRSATVARPTLKEAKEVFALRLALEREAVRLVIENWKPEFGAILDGNIREEEAAAAAGNAPASIRLAGEFHITLASLTDNELLRRFLGELVSRCSLILAVYRRPHSSDCAINEHRDIVHALRRRDANRAIALMEAHVGSVAQRALIFDSARTELELSAVLSKYAGAVAVRGSAVDIRSAKSKVRKR
jgi:DNA-binding GntR family transcriptional regulator